jgi:hypothetical protein
MKLPFLIEIGEDARLEVWGQEVWEVSEVWGQTKLPPVNHPTQDVYHLREAQKFRARREIWEI